MTVFGRPVRHLWPLHPEMVFLNHGAYGATPWALLEAQTHWRRRMETQPVRFLMDELPALVAEAVAGLAPFIGADPARTVLVENASSAINAVLHSLDFRPGDRIVTTDHVYNAVRKTLQHVADRTGVEVVECPVPMPVTGPNGFLQALDPWLKPPTRLVVADHIASATAVRLPVEDIAVLCRARGLLVLVDGAHAPGQLDLSVDAVGADWYVGNGHKWLCTPKGVAFLVARDDAAMDVNPTVISHAYGQGFKAEFAKIGTRDPSAWLCLPDAVAFHRRLGDAVLRDRNADLARAGTARVSDVLGTRVGAPAELFAAMTTVEVPGDLPADQATALRLREALWTGHQVDALVQPHSGRLWLRLCAHAYTDEADFEAVPPAVTAAVAAVGAGVC